MKTLLNAISYPFDLLGFLILFGPGAIQSKSDTFQGIASVALWGLVLWSIFNLWRF